MLLNQAVWQVQQCCMCNYNMQYCAFLNAGVLQVDRSPAMLATGIQPHRAAGALLHCLLGSLRGRASTTQPAVTVDCLMQSAGGLKQPIQEAPKWSDHKAI